MSDLARLVEGPPDAPPVVLLHSLGSDVSMWRPQAEDLARDHLVVRIDTRGHGGSPAPPGPYNLGQLGRDVVAVADDLGLDTFHLVGCSLGGLTALWVAIHHGDRLRTLTAANTAAKVADAAFWQARIDAVRTHGLDGIRDEVVARFFADGFSERHPDWFAEALDVFAAADPDGYAGCCAALAHADLRGDIADVTVPTLVVGGRQDVATPPSDAEWLHAHLPDSRLVVLDAAAHLSNLDQPDPFTDILRSHLEDHP